MHTTAENTDELLSGFLATFSPCQEETKIVQIMLTQQTKAKKTKSPAQEKRQKTDISERRSRGIKGASLTLTPLYL